MAIDLDPGKLKGGAARDRDRRDALVRGLRLTDGGLYDNMALEPVWKDHRVVLVSDGGATFDPTPDAGLRDTLKRLGRYSALQGRQASAVRKRWLIANYKLEQLDGTYWGIGSAASHYDRNLHGYGAALVDDYVSEIRTDLDHFTDPEAQVLQNHGYTLTDAALRTHSAAWWPHDLGPASAPFPDWLDNENEICAALAQSHKRKLPFGRWGRS